MPRQSHAPCASDQNRSRIPSLRLRAGRVTADIRERLHGHIESLQLRYFNRRESGELVARVMHDTGELRGFLVEGLPYLLVNGLSFVTIAVILFNLDARLTLFVLLPVPFLVGGGGRRDGRRAESLRAKRSRHVPL